MFICREVSGLKSDIMIAKLQTSNIICALRFMVCGQVPIEKLLAHIYIFHIILAQMHTNMTTK